jgi:hypothetical protein
VRCGGVWGLRVRGLPGVSTHVGVTASRAVLTRASVWCAQRELIFDKYHQSLYNTVVHLLAPGQSAAAEQAAWAAWNLISEVICVCLLAFAVLFVLRSSW